MNAMQKFRPLCVLALGLAIVLIPTLALTDEEKAPEDVAIEHRRAHMQLIWRDFGPVLSMAKGDMEYDAATAQVHADNLRALSSYNPTALFPAGTAKPDRDGDTRALPAIWERLDDFLAAYGNFTTAMAQVAEVASNGQPELAAAVFDAGKSCGACHDDFRAEKFE